MIKVYGIPNCDTVKKAKNWLKNKKLEFEFHDYRKEGITKAKLQEWFVFFGWQNVLNKKGTTWKNAGAEKQGEITNRKAAINF